VTEKGTGFKYNQFMSERVGQIDRAEQHHGEFTVKSILYADGSRNDFE
jgi:hypothetical protein